MRTMLKSLTLSIAFAAYALMGSSPAHAAAMSLTEFCASKAGQFVIIDMGHGDIIKYCKEGEFRIAIYSISSTAMS